MKRLMREAVELRDATEDYFAQPLEDNLFEWHFTVRGPPDSEFEGGFYHGRIILPPEYPMKPPNIIVLTPNGRFEVSTKICLSISGHHPETWQPSWSIRTALLAIIGFMPTPARGTVGSMDYTPEERRMLAKKSLKWMCSTCGPIKDLLLVPGSNAKAAKAVHNEARLLVSQIDLKSEPNQPPISEAPRTQRVAAPELPREEPRNNTNNTAVHATRIVAMDNNGQGNVATSNVFILLIVVAIAMLLYRRVFLLQEVEGEL